MSAHEKPPSRKSAESKRGRKAWKDGHGFEDEVVARLRKVLPSCYEIRRSEPGDVTIYLHDEPLLFIQCKNHKKKPNIRQALEQARHDVKSTAAPASLTRGEGDIEVFSIEFSNLIWLLLRAEQNPDDHGETLREECRKSPETRRRVLSDLRKGIEGVS